MIYPSQRAILLLLAALPVLLALVIAVPQLWLLALAWIIIIALMMLIDALIGARIEQADLHIDADPFYAVGHAGAINVRLSHPKQPIPPSAELAGAFGGVLADLPPLRLDKAALPTDDQHSETMWNWRAGMTPDARGEGRLDELVLRWTGPLGLMWKGRTFQPATSLPIIPNINPLKDEGIKVYLREAAYGSLVQRRRGEGREFDALTDYQPGMDRRAIHWKQSARHQSLLAAEYRAERNNRVVIAIDNGRNMCEPVGNLSKLDHAISAAMMLALVGLKAADRISLTSFAARPGGHSGIYSDPKQFRHLHHSAAKIGYEYAETNYTWGLAEIGRTLSQRSLIIVFTEISDPVNSSLLIDAIGRLSRRHLVACVLVDDAELQNLTHQQPDDMKAMHSAVIAEELAQTRRVTLEQLRRLGAHVVVGDAAHLGPQLLERYFQIKQRGWL